MRRVLLAVLVASALIGGVNAYAAWFDVTAEDIASFHETDVSIETPPPPACHTVPAAPNPGLGQSHTPCPTGGAFVGATTGQTTGGDLVISKPSPNFQAGDLLIAAITIEGGTANLARATGNPHPTADWTEIGPAVNHGGNHGMGLYWKIAGSGEQGQYRWTTGGKKATGTIVVYRFVDASDPIHAVAGQSGTGDVMTAPGVATTEPHTVLLVFFGTKISSVVDHPAPAGMTRRAMTTFGDGFNTSVHDQPVSDVGPTGDRSSDTAAGTSNEWVARTVAITWQGPS